MDQLDFLNIITNLPIKGKGKITKSLKVIQDFDIFMREKLQLSDEAFGIYIKTFANTIDFDKKFMKVLEAVGEEMDDGMTEEEGTLIFLVEFFPVLKELYVVLAENLKYDKEKVGNAFDEVCKFFVSKENRKIVFSLINSMGKTV